MSVSYWQKNKSPAHHSVDIVIIGAGLSGISNAYWINKLDPHLKIIVVDKGEVGNGASGRNAGFITCGSTDHFSNMTSSYGDKKATEIWKFTEENHKLIVKELGHNTLFQECEYKQQGSWTLASSEHEAKIIQKDTVSLQKKNVCVYWKDQYALEQRFRNTESSAHCITGFYGGAHYMDDAEVNPIKLIKATIKKMGSIVKVMTYEEVHGITEYRDRLQVNTSNLLIETDFVVLATNAWLSQLFSYFEDKIFPTRGQIIVTEPVDMFLEPCYCSFVLDYFRQLKDGSVLIGGFRNTDVEKEVGLSDEVNPIIHRKLQEFLNKHFPILRGVPIKHQWSGVMGYSKDSYPMVGSLPEDSRIFFTGGFTGHGLGFTFNIGRTLAELMINGKDPGIFGARRFN